MTRSRCQPTAAAPFTAACNWSAAPSSAWKSAWERSDMRFTLLLLVLLVGVPAVEGQRVASDYIRIVTQPAFQYRTDQDISIPTQVRLVRGGVPQADLVSLEVRWANGTP